MRSIMMLAAVAGAIWYAAPEAGKIAKGAGTATAGKPAMTRWSVSGTGVRSAGCDLILGETEGAGELGKSPGCAATDLAEASRWWEAADGNIVLASASGERIAEFAADETDGLVSVWPGHTIVTLRPAR